MEDLRQLSNVNFPPTVDDESSNTTINVHHIKTFFWLRKFLAKISLMGCQNLVVCSASIFSKYSHICGAKSAKLGRVRVVAVIFTFLKMSLFKQFAHICVTKV